MEEDGAWGDSDTLFAVPGTWSPGGWDHALSGRMTPQQNLAVGSSRRAAPHVIYLCHLFVLAVCGGASG